MSSQELPSTGEPLRRAITGPLLLFFILGDVLGAGVYTLAGTIAGRVGGALWAPLLLALVFALLVAGSYAELVTKYPRAGGAAVFAAKAFKRPLISFLVGFCMVAAGVTSAAGLAVAFAGDYLSAFIPVPPTAAALVFLVAIALLNARGIKESLSANLVMTLIELSGLLIVIACGVYLVSQGQGNFGQLTEFRPGVSPGVAVLGGALLAFYSFVGFETSANLAEEVRDVRRVYPIALFASLLIAGLVYVLVALAASLIVPIDQLANSTAPLLEVVRASGLGIPPRWFAVIALVAVANGALLTMIMASRLTYGMAREGLLPDRLASVLPVRRTPGMAILWTTLVAMALTFTSTLEVLAGTVVLLLLVVFLSTNIAVLVLRKDVVADRHFRVPTIVPWLSIGCCLLLASQQSLETVVRGGGLLLLGVVLFGVTRLGKSASAQQR